MSKHDSRGGADAGAGLRGLRLATLFRTELNYLLDNEITDPRLQGTRVTEVELSRDGSRARIWFSMNPNDTSIPTRDVASAFERAAGFLRVRLGEALPLKRMPELRFRHDPAFRPPEAGVHDTAPDDEPADAES